jgi:hypothetical protein
MTTRVATRTTSWAVAIAAALAAPVATFGATGDRGEARCAVHSETRLSHVRTLDTVLADALEDGLSRSPSLRRLVERIEGFNGIVYLDAGALAPRGLPGEAGRYRLTGATSQDVVLAGDYRFLKVKVELRPGNLTIATIGHELQHVIEVLETPEARDLRSVERLFARIGYLVRPGVYETTAAQSAGDQVFRELSRCSRLDPPPSSEPIVPNVTR